MYRKSILRHLIIVPLIVLGICSPVFSGNTPEWLDFEYGGHFKAKASLSWFDAETPLRMVKDNPFLDGSSELRLNSETFAGDLFSFKVHYLNQISGGQTREKENELQAAAPALPSYASAVSEPEDETRFLDLTRPYTVAEDYRAYHRLDRLSLTYQPSWGMLRLGRQAVTWGNGLLFNPMDLFNPFSPRAIDKDYKTGEDMAYCRVYTEKAGSWQLLYVPRRDAADGETKWEHSSLAAKVRYFYGDLELNFLAAEHYKDEVVGLGISSYLGGAAWRVDATRTFLNSDIQRSDFWNLTANIDYSWTWWGKNWYGFLEYYHFGLGTTRYQEAVSDPVLMDRLERGETFVLGENYLAGHLRIEIHPLVNLYLTVINNLHDPSGSVQPRLTWDAKQNVTFTLGSTLYYGEKGTEFGGIEAPSSNYRIKPANSLYLWATLYF